MGRRRKDRDEFENEVGEPTGNRGGLVGRRNLYQIRRSGRHSAHHRLRGAVRSRSSASQVVDT